ncbi:MULTISPECIES: DUF1192 domain-containing protein [Nitratireductor]|uniref:DUF1192 domain-containing protein n=1 Tax=Nitratireductor TaxID=245876 RepID=UPI000D0DBE02|nr:MULTISPECIES: DUF1192 domain-containing protein [Nitratireductor]PSM19095.1 DUF1192 domain-containing protein [Nitratireductor sp. StC3]
MIFADDQPKKARAHEIGQDVSLLSEHELAERVEMLRAEIARLEAEMAARGTTKAAAEALFRRG